MNLMLEFLKSKHACVAGLAWFEKRFGLEADYQAVLNLLAKEELAPWAAWVLNKVGPIDEVMEISGERKIEGHLFVAGHLKCAAGVHVELSIKAGSGIEAGEGIEAGDDFGIYCGLRIKIPMKANFACVYASASPKNLLLGEYRGRRRHREDEKGTIAN